MVALSDVNAYPFLAVTLRTQKSVFSDFTLLPDSKETKRGNSNQEASPSVLKGPGKV